MNKPERVLPIPCVNVQGRTVKDWFQKINEELDELKDAVLWALDLNDNVADLKDYDFEEDDKYERKKIVEEAADTITVITSMLEAMGINEAMRQEAQRRVNERNKERGRL